jgi:glycosyltransferase involved in cell wall biosynthesis
LELRRIPTSPFKLGAALKAEHSCHDVLHLHKVWGTLEWTAMRFAGGGGAPIIVDQHGNLSPWSLNHKRLKKSVALALTWRRTLQRVEALHAVNDIEGADIRREFAGARVEVLPNGVDIDCLNASSENPDGALASLTGGRAFVLFLARLHLMKGPDRLIEAFAIAARQRAFADVDLIVAGPDYGMLAGLKRQVARLGIEARVRFIGEVAGSVKVALLRHALCMCQPSRHEGFSMSLLEALASSLPVVTTPESNFPEIGKFGAGLVVGPDPEELAGALQRLVADPDLRARMGAAGARLVRQEFTWPATAQRSLALYQDLCRRPRAAAS